MKNLTKIRVILFATAGVLAALTWYGASDRGVRAFWWGCEIVILAALMAMSIDGEKDDDA